MRIHYRKSINIGNTKVNISDGGVGISHGIKGLRVGIDAKGREYVSGGIPGSGLYFREYQGNRPYHFQIQTLSKTERRQANLIVLGIGLSIIFLTMWGIVCANS